MWFASDAARRGYGGRAVLWERRGRDSNPRWGLSPIQHFQCCSFGHSDTSPGLLLVNSYGILAVAAVVFTPALYWILNRNPATRPSTRPFGGSAGVGGELYSHSPLFVQAKTSKCSLAAPCTYPPLFQDVLRLSLDGLHGNVSGGMRRAVPGRVGRRLAWGLPRAPESVLPFPGCTLARPVDPATLPRLAESLLHRVSGLPPSHRWDDSGHAVPRTGRCRSRAPREVDG